VRFAWQHDSSVSSEERVVRGAVALLDSEEQRLKGAMRLPTQFGPRRELIDRSTEERDRAREVIARPASGWCRPGAARPSPALSWIHRRSQCR
jgi:hypothetical protein